MGEFLSNPETWVAVAFVIFVTVLGRKIFKAVTGALDKRTAQIKHDLDEAARLREEAAQLLVSYQNKGREAEQEAQGIVAHAREEAERRLTEAEQELVGSLARRRQQALENIARAEAQAVQEVREQAVDLALKATRKLIADNLTEARDAKLVAEAIAGVGKKLH